MKDNNLVLTNKIDPKSAPPMMRHVLDFLSMLPISCFMLDLESSEFLFGNDYFQEFQKREGKGIAVIKSVFELFKAGEPSNPVEIHIQQRSRSVSVGYLAWRFNEAENGSHLIGILEDRTELLELNRKLDDHRAILEMTLNHVQLGSWYWNLLDETIELHGPMLTLMSWGPEKALMTFDEFKSYIHHEDLPLFECRLQQMSEDSVQEDPFDIRVMDKDEIQIVLRCKSLISRKDENGFPIGAVGTCIDVTDYRKNYELICLQRDLAMTLGEPDDLYVSLQKCADLVRNRISLGFVGIYVQEEEPPWNFRMVSKTEGNQVILDSIASVSLEALKKINVSLDKPYYVPYQELVDKGLVSGEDSNYNAIAMIPFPIGNGLFGGIVAGSKTRDDLGGLTKTSLESLSHLMSALFKKKRIEQKLQQSEQQYRTLYQNMNQGMALLELIYHDSQPVDYKLLENNSAFSSILDLPDSQEIQGKDASNLFGRRRIPFLNELDQVLTTGKPCRFSRYEPIVGKHLGLSAFIYRDEKVALLVHDETHQKKVERQSMHAQKMEAISRLSGGIAHDFNNLLQIIVGYAEMLKPIPGAGPAADHIMEASSSAMDLVRKLSMFDSIQDTHYKNVYVDVVIHNTLKMMSWLIEQNIHVELEPSETTRPIWADPSMLEQIFINMCLNSRDAMPLGGIIRIRTGMVALGEEESGALNLASGEYVKVSIIDTGKGIPDDIIDKIFDPFFTTKPFGEASGLGLSTVYTILQKLGGIVQVIKNRNGADSRNGHGASHANTISDPGAQFDIYLPISNQSPVSVPVKPRKKIEPVGKACILLAEDEPEVRELLMRRLEKEGYTVITATNGPEAVIKFNKHSDSINILILDQIMPGMTGTAAYEMIQRQRKDIPVIFSSGYTTERINRSKFDQSHVAFLSKPYRHKELMQTIQQLLE